MKRLVYLFSALAPPAVLVLFTLFPALDTTHQNHVFHFYIVTITSFSAAVISFLLGWVLGPVARPRHALIALAFAYMGMLFFTHGLATPNVLVLGGAGSDFHFWVPSA